MGPCMPVLMLLATTMPLITAVTHVSVHHAKYSLQRPSETTRLAKRRLQHFVCVCISLDIVFLHVLSMSYSIYLHKISYIARFILSLSF